MKCVPIVLGLLLGSLATTSGWIASRATGPRAVPEAGFDDEFEVVSDALETQTAAIKTLSRQVGQLLSKFELMGRLDSHEPTVPPREPREQEAPVEALSIEEKRQALREILATTYGDFSDTWILNRVLESDDEYLKAFALKLWLDGIDNTEFLLNYTHATIGPQSVAVAEVLAEHKEATFEALVDAFETQRFPRNYGAALALHKQGDSRYLDDWSLSAVANLPTLSRKSVGRVLDACMAYDVPDSLAIALEAARSTEPSVRLKTIGLLAKLSKVDESARAALERLVTDSDPEVASRAQLTVHELPLAQED